jgi:hypothetical protein
MLTDDATIVRKRKVTIASNGVTFTDSYAQGSALNTSVIPHSIYAR